MASVPLKTFIIYAREDRDALLELKKHLVPLERRGQITVWYDGEITGGEEWQKTIKTNLETAQIILLFLSADFFASDYIEKKELKEALKRHERGESTVVPVIVRHCSWQQHPEIEKLQVLPDNAIPVFAKKHWEPDESLTNVADGIARIIQSRSAEKERLEAARKAEAEAQKRNAEAAAQAEAARKKREAEAAEQKRKAEELRQKGHPEMIPVKGGTFQMGEKGIDEPFYAVNLSDFEIGKYPVTQQLWKEIMGANPSFFKGDDLPVEKVSWDDVQGFLEKLNARFPGYKYRLPTEAEWEYAARGGTNTKGYQYAGSNDLNEVGWYSENSKSKTHPIGHKKANELGIHDMSGNVWELCADWYGAYPSGAQTNSSGPDTGSSRVGRGGSWFYAPAVARVASRSRWRPVSRDYDIGFRLARTS